MADSPQPTFGEYFRQKRLSLGFSLRAFCQEFGYDPGNISKLERSRHLPPDPDPLKRYAANLGIEAPSDEWTEFSDLASLGRGTLPADILNDEEIMNKLPMIFRTFRGGKPTEEQLQELIEVIRRS